MQRISQDIRIRELDPAYWTEFEELLTRALPDGWNVIMRFVTRAQLVPLAGYQRPLSVWFDHVVEVDAENMEVAVWIWKDDPAAAVSSIVNEIRMQVEGVG